ncbi:MAG TPA: VanW family protein [Feifaniaceae bacterium]|nr:VanW family protein [Feifaniaceae bacterium]
MEDIPNASGPANEVSAEPKVKKRTVWIITAACVLLALLAGALYSEKLQRDEAERLAIINAEVFRDGVFIDGIAVGGMTKGQAKAAVEAAQREQEDAVSFQLTYGGKSHQADASAFAFAYDTEAVLDGAFSLAREGTLKELEEELSDISLNKRAYSTASVPDEKAVEAFVASLAEAVDTPAMAAQFKVLIDKTSATEEEKKKSAYVLAAASTTPEQRFRYEPEQDGVSVDRETLAQALLSMAQSGDYADMELPVEPVKARVTLADVKRQVVLRGSSYTSFNKSPYNRGTRVFNIKKAVGLINGTVLQPGEVFSANDTLGHRTYGGGWKPAPAIVQGRTEDQAGGGVCQVSTTMYLCVLKSGLEVVYRQAHSGRLSYVDGGLDATIDSGRIDFQWKNNTGTPVYLFCWVDDSDRTVHFELYGAPFPEEYDEIRLSSKRVGGISPSGPMKYTVDRSKPAGYKEVYVARKSGSVWQSYAAYFKDGVKVKTVPVAQTKYRAYAGETIIGPGANTGA